MGILSKKVFSLLYLPSLFHGSAELDAFSDLPPHGTFNLVEWAIRGFSICAPNIPCLLAFGAELRQCPVFESLRFLWLELWQCFLCSIQDQPCDMFYLIVNVINIAPGLTSERWRPRAAAPCRVALMGHGPTVQLPCHCNRNTQFASGSRLNRVLPRNFSNIIAIIFPPPAKQ